MGVKYDFIFGTSLASAKSAVGKAIYQDYLPTALKQGKFVAAPEPMVVGKGLDSFQSALGEQRKGVSAKKIVVQL